MEQVPADEQRDIAALAAELARLRGVDASHVLAQTLRDLIDRERISRLDRTERDWQAMAWLAKWHELLPNPPPASDHSWLYDDETGLPI